MNTDWLEHFDLQEFESPDKPGSGEKMSVQVLSRLDYARELAGIPFVINSGYRTQEHNKEVGGVEDSAHTRGLAADIAYAGSRKRFQIVDAVRKAGFNRIGIAQDFIHVDLSEEKDQDVLWLY